VTKAGECLGDLSGGSGATGGGGGGGGAHGVCVHWEGGSGGVREWGRELMGGVMGGDGGIIVSSRLLTHSLTHSLTCFLRWCGVWSSQAAQRIPVSRRIQYRGIEKCATAP
jgi:hypothetical protein